MVILLDMVITNSFILTSFVPFSTTTLTAHSLKSFRLTLSAQLIGQYNSRRRLRQQPSSASLLSSSPFTTDTVQPTPLAQPLHLPTHSRSKQCVYCRVPPKNCRLFVCSSYFVRRDGISQGIEIVFKNSSMMYLNIAVTD